MQTVQHISLDRVEVQSEGKAVNSGNLSRTSSMFVALVLMSSAWTKAPR